MVYINLFFREEDVFILRTTVRRSQSVNKSNHNVWAAVKRCGIVISAHCTCMAGLGEVCSHIAALLFKTWLTQERLAEKCLSSDACTSNKCTWIVPNLMPQVSAKPLADIKFSSKNMQQSTSQVVQCNVQQPSFEEQKQFYAGFQSADVKKLPVVLSIQPQLCNLFVPPSRSSKYPILLNSLYDSEADLADQATVDNKCNNIFLSYAVTDEQTRNLERDTRHQSASKLWFSHRAGRITSSVFKQCVSTNIEKPSVSLLRKVCYPLSQTFHATATKWGCDHEKDAIKVYMQVQASKHTALELANSGLQINSKYPWMAASPDAIVFCACHGWGCVEVKCPFKCVTKKMDELTEHDKTFCLKKSDNGVCLKKNHPYYFQVHMHMICTGFEYCDFVVWCPEASVNNNELHVERIEYDTAFATQFLPRAIDFVKKCIVPELFCRQYTRRCMKVAASSHNHKQTVPVDISEPNELIDVCLTESMTSQCVSASPSIEVNSASTAEADLVVCYCKQIFVSETGMLKCTFDKCSSGRYFHVTCLEYKRVPKKEGWICFECRKQAAAAKRKRVDSIDRPV